LVWLGQRRGHAVDWITQRWVQLTGRRVALIDAPWLSGPCGSVRGIGADFFDQWGRARGLTVIPAGPDDGLIPELSALRGRSFDAASVHPIIDRFYRHTASFDLQIESRWSGPFRAIGWLVGRVFARRLAQLNLPLSSRELNGGMSSRIVRLANARGQVLHTAWVRTSVRTGLPVFVGQYGTETIPGHDGPCVKVVFPLPNGNAIVLLRPRVERDGGLSLVSDGRRFGDPGFYFTVQAEPGCVWARYVRTMKEELRLHVEGTTLGARHRFSVFGLPFLELVYRITAKSDPRH
jgi:hypothetical protein